MKKLIIYIFFSFSLVFSQDGWHPQNIETTSMLGDVQFVNPDTGWITVDWGYGQGVYKTNNGGETWTLQDSTNQINTIFFLDDNSGWGGGGIGRGTGLIYYKGSNSEQWVLQDTVEGIVSSIHFVDSLYGWTAGIAHGFEEDEYHTSRTLSGGDTWKETNLENLFRWTDIYFLNKNTGWAAGAAGGILGYTNDGGENWQQKIISDHYTLSSIFFTDSSKGWTVGNIYKNGAIEKGLIMNTDDSGENWYVQDSVRSQGLNALYFYDEKTGWAVGDSGLILYTIDGGIKWIKQISNSNEHFQDVYFVSPSIGWIVGSNGIILKTINSGVTSINSKVKTHIQSFELKQNYPNPFNPSTIIQYYLKSKSEVQLTIFDLSGREIKTLVNQLQNSGQHAISFDASGLASGIYIYKLKAGSFEQSRKMLLVR